MRIEREDREIFPSRDGSVLTPTIDTTTVVAGSPRETTVVGYRDAGNMTDMVLAIDCFRLISDPLGSIASYLSEVVRSLCLQPRVRKLYLVLPRKPQRDFIHNKLAELNKVEFVYPAAELFPENSFLSEIYWVHVVVPTIVRKKIKSTNYYIAPYHHPPILLPKKISVVTVIHDLCGLRSDCGYRKTGRGFYEHLFRFLMASIRSDVLIPISHYTKSELGKSFPFLSSRISSVVHNGVSCQTLNETLFNNALRKYNLSQQRYFLGFGSPTLRKGIDLTLDSYRRYR